MRKMEPKTKPGVSWGELLCFLEKHFKSNSGRGHQSKSQEEDEMPISMARVKSKQRDVPIIKRHS